MSPLSATRTIAAALLAGVLCTTAVDGQTFIDPGILDTPGGVLFSPPKLFRPEFYVAGSGGTVLRYDASLDQWTDISVPGENRELLGLHGSRRSNVWLGAFHQTAENLRLYRWTGSAWGPHVLTNDTLPQIAIDRRPRPGGIWTFGRANTYAAVVAQQADSAWWLVWWNGVSWSLLETASGGSASGGAFAVSPDEIYFVGRPDGTAGAGLWRYDGSAVQQFPAGFGLPDVGRLNGVARQGQMLVVSGITDGGRQGIWTGTFDTTFTLELEAPHGNAPLVGRANNWCATDGRSVRVVGVDAMGRAAVYVSAGGAWIELGGLAQEQPCGDSVQAAFTRTATMVALRSCNQGGNDTHALSTQTGVWSLENPPGQTSWNSIWATTSVNPLLLPGVVFLQGILSDALIKLGN